MISQNALFSTVFVVLLGYGSLAPIESNSTSSDRFSINELESSQYHSKNGSSLHRGATYTKNQRFKNGIVPYSFSGAHDLSEQAIIVSAMATFSAKTGGCIKWVPRTTEEDFVTIVKEGGCAAGFRRLYLEAVCYNGPHATAILHHEMMHEIGFQHEQQRTDQDDHITILWDNIKEEGKLWYQKQAADNQNLPYDINSILHYNAYDFAIDRNKPTMVAKNGKPVGPGIAGLMTELDILKIRRFYDCDKGGEASTSTSLPAVTGTSISTSLPAVTQTSTSKSPPAVTGASTPTSSPAVTGASTAKVVPAFTGIRFKDCDKALQAGVSMFPGQKIVSPGGKTELRMTTEGNLILVSMSTNEIIFQTTTKGYRAEMQRDGNFVVYDHNNKALWATGTDNYNFGNRGATQVVVLDNGTFSVLDKAGKAAWSNEGSLGGRIPV